MSEHAHASDHDEHAPSHDHGHGHEESHGHADSHDAHGAHAGHDHHDHAHSHDHAHGDEHGHAHGDEHGHGDAHGHGEHWGDYNSDPPEPNKLAVSPALLGLMGVATVGLLSAVVWSSMMLAHAHKPLAEGAATHAHEKASTEKPEHE